MKPETSADLVGNPVSREKLRKWLSAFVLKKTPKDTEPAVLLWGNPGTTKTTSIHVLVREQKLEPIVFNMSVVRKMEIALDLFYADRRPAVAVILEEIDTLDAQQVRTLTEALQKLRPHNPVICTANGLSTAALRTLSDNCLTIRFWPLNEADLRQLALRICPDRKHISPTFLQTARGDARQFIQSLQCSSGGSGAEDAGKQLRLDIFETVRRLVTQGRKFPLAARVQAWSSCPQPRWCLDMVRHNFPHADPALWDYLCLLHELQETMWDDHEGNATCPTFYAYLTHNAPCADLEKIRCPPVSNKTSSKWDPDMTFMQFILSKQPTEKTTQKRKRHAATPVGVKAGVPRLSR